MPVDVPTSDGTTAESPTGGRYLQLVLVLGALIALGPLTIDMYLPAFPAIGAELGASDSAVQLTLTGMLGGLAFGQLIIGPLSDAFERRKPLLVGVVAHAVASVLCALAPNIFLLSGVRILQGFAGAAISVVAMAMVRDLFSGVAVARLMSRLMLVIGLAPILAPSLGGLILEWTTWRGIFGVLAAAAVVLTAVAFLGVRETLPPTRRRPADLRSTLATYKSLLRDRTFVALVLIGGLLLSAVFAYVAGSSFVLQGGYGLDEKTFGLVFGANAVGLALASQLNPTLIHRFSVVNVLSGATVVGVLSAAALLGAVQFGVGALVASLVGLPGSGSAVPMGAVMLGVTLLASLLMFGVVRRDETATSLG